MDRLVVSSIPNPPGIKIKHGLKMKLKVFLRHQFLVVKMEGFNVFMVYLSHRKNGEFSINLVLILHHEFYYGRHLV